MIFSILEKLERGERALDARELALMRPYWGLSSLRELQTLSNLLTLHKATRQDKEWAAEIDAQLVYEMMFRNGGGPLGGAVRDIVGANDEYMESMQSWVLRRSLVEGDMKAFALVMQSMRDRADGRGLKALAEALSYNNNEALYLAAAYGRDETLHEIFEEIDDYVRGRSLIDLDDADFLTNMVAVATRGEDGHEDTVAMLFDRARNAGVMNRVMRAVLPTILVHAALSMDEGRLDRAWQRGLDVLGAGSMSEISIRGIQIIATQPEGGQIARLLTLVQRDLGTGPALEFMQKATDELAASKPAVTAVMEAAHGMGGVALTDHLLRSRNCRLMYWAAMQEDTEMLRMLERYLEKPRETVAEMLGGDFMRNLLLFSSPVNVDYLARRAVEEHGVDGVRPLGLALGDIRVADRADYWDILMAVTLAVEAASAATGQKGADLALPAEVAEILYMRSCKEVPPHRFWQMMGGGHSRWQAVTRRNAPEGLHPTDSPWHFKPVLYEQLLPHMRRLIALENIKGTDAEKLAHKFAVLFANVDEVERYIDRAIGRARPQQRVLPFTDAASFGIPQRGEWDVAHWRGLLMKHGRTVGRFISIASQIEAECHLNDQPMPRTVDEVMDAARFVAYNDAEENPEFARLALEHNLSRELFTKGVKILAERGKTDDKLPVVTIDGAAIGKPNYYMQKLPANDPRGLLLGHITNNCQSLGNNGEYAAIDGMTSPTSGFYVWKQKTKGHMTDGDRIVAQCWAWAAMNPKDIVFDSYERLSPDYDHLARPFLEQYAYDLTQAGTLSRVFLGAGGGTPRGMGLKKAAAPARQNPLVLIHPDSEVQYTIKPVNHRNPA